MKIISSNDNLCCQDIIQSVFELNNLDFEVFKKLRELKQSKVDVIARIMDKDRSMIYRSLQKLMLCKLCEKKTENIRTGGYYHIYVCTDLKSVRDEIEKCIDNWYKSIKNNLDNLEKEL